MTTTMLSVDALVANGSDMFIWQLGRAEIRPIAFDKAPGNNNTNFAMSANGESALFVNGTSVMSVDFDSRCRAVCDLRGVANELNWQVASSDDTDVVFVTDVGTRFANGSLRLLRVERSSRSVTESLIDCPDSGAYLIDARASQTVYLNAQSGGHQDLVIQPWVGATVRIPLTECYNWIRFSPSRRRVVLSSARVGIMSIVELAKPATEKQLTVRGRAATWQDEDTILYHRDGELEACHLPTQRTRTVFALSPGVRAPAQAAPVDVSPDGSRIAWSIKGDDEFGSAQGVVLSTESSLMIQRSWYQACFLRGRVPSIRKRAQ